MRELEHSTGRDASRLAVALAPVTVLKWSFRWRVLKYNDIADPRDITPDTVPDEVVEVEGNGLLNGGIAVLLNRLITDAPGANDNAFSNANARMKVGNGNAVFSAAHTDLQGATTTEKAMDATYPQRAGQTVTWQASFGAAEANHAWEEWGIKNGAGAASASVVMLNRKVGTLGTKATGTWTLQGTVTIS